ncbi:MAG: ABC transporter permease [Candidatus Lokiarchaeota archaeon]|nr:ABC transporter permease [Candidatus Lokiarchaeota archaeon]
MGEINKEFLIAKKSRFNNFKTQIKRSFIITKKDLKIYYNKPPVLIQGIFFPVILFFAFTIGRNISPIYLNSGIIAMVLFLTSTSLGPIIFPWETMRGTFERLTTCPVSIKTILIGSIWGSFIYGLLFSSIPLVLGVIFLSSGLVINYFLIIAGMIIASLVFSSFSLIISAPPTRNPGNTMILQIIIKFPLLFISPLFMPIASIPTAVISPITYCLDVINVGLGEVSAFGSFGLIIDILVLLGFGFGFLFLAFAIHQKTLEKRFK